MASWTIFSELQDILILYYFGTNLAFAVTLLAIMLISFIGAGAPLRYALLFVLPLAGGIAIGGWLGLETWVLNVLLIAVGFIYGFVVIGLVNK